MKKMSVWKNMILWLIVIAAFAFFMQPHDTVSLESFDETLKIQGESGYTIDLVYDEIQNVELIENLDYGVMIKGVDENKEKSGIWKNDEFGEYQLCVNAKIDSCIVLHIENGIQVVNYESNKSTESLYEAILTRIE